MQTKEHGKIRHTVNMSYSFKGCDISCCHLQFFVFLICNESENKQKHFYSVYFFSLTSFWGLTVNSSWKKKHFLWVQRVCVRTRERERENLIYFEAFRLIEQHSLCNWNLQVEIFKKLIYKLESSRNAQKNRHPEENSQHGCPGRARRRPPWHCYHDGSGFYRSR